MKKTLNRNLSIKNADPIFKRVKDILAHNRRTRTLPLQASTSVGTLIDEKNSTAEGMAALRLIHGLPPLWRAFSRAKLMMDGSKFAAPYWAFGGVAARRKEELMVTIRLGMWRMRRVGLNFVLKSYDMKNAFACGDPNLLKEVVSNRCGGGLDEDDNRLQHGNAELLSTKRNNTTVCIHACDDTAAVAPHTGGTMGDSNEPEIVMECFYAPVEEWRAMHTRAGSSGAFLATRVFLMNQLMWAWAPLSTT